MPHDPIMRLSLLKNDRADSPSARAPVSDVRCQRRMQHLDGLKPERFDTVKDALAGPEQNRGDVEREFINDSGDERLPYSGCAARDVYATVA